jgi:hypothetical protein
MTSKQHLRDDLNSWVGIIIAGLGGWNGTIVVGWTSHELELILGDPPFTCKLKTQLFQQRW